MGVFVETFGEPSFDEISEEYRSRMEELFWRGGMMELGKVTLFDVTVYTLRRPRIKMYKHDFPSSEFYGFDVTYNYFDDHFWENSGFNAKKGTVYSNKVGSYMFRHTVIAAKILMGLYSKTPVMTYHDGFRFWLPRKNGYISWINGLFGSDFKCDEMELWDVIEDKHSKNPTVFDKKREYENFEQLMEYSFPRCAEIAAMSAVFTADKVLETIENSLEMNRDMNDECYYRNFCRSILDIVTDFKNSSELSDEEQVKYFTDLITLPDGEIKNRDKNDSLFYASITVLKHPAFALRVMADLYGKDFWELWNTVRGNYPKSILDPIAVCEPVSTEDLFFDDKTDDMLVYWSEDNDFKFSEDMQKWLDHIKEKYDNYVQGCTKPFYSVRGIFELIQRAQKRYPEFMIFEDFLNETIENSAETEIQLLWKNFEDFLDESDEKKISDSDFKKTVRNFIAFFTNKALRCKILNDDR